MSTLYNNIIPQATSPNENTVFLRSNFIPTTNIVIKNKSVPVLDIANLSLLTLIKNLKPIQLVDSENKTLPVIAYKNTQTTSTWWMIGILNGVIHPLQLQQGQKVLIPDVTSAVTTLGNSSSASAGSTVVF